jgi:hypothetical protein
MTRRSLSVAPAVPFHEPDLTPEHKAAIVEALRWAWSELKRRDPKTLQTGDEESITSMLQSILNERRDGKRVVPWLKDFETVSRSENQVTVDGRLQKKPDLTFRPPPYQQVLNTTRWGWFVECKLIDGSASVTLYREKGVRRYYKGEYAAWMPSGALLGYARDGALPTQTLRKALHRRVGTKSVRGGPTPDRCESEHDRSRLSMPCVVVTLIHIWLPVPGWRSRGRGGSGRVRRRRRRAWSFWASKLSGRGSHRSRRGRSARRQAPGAWRQR